MLRRSLPIKKGISTIKRVLFQFNRVSSTFSSYMCMKFNVFQILRDYIYMPSMKTIAANFYD